MYVALSGHKTASKSSLSLPQGSGFFNHYKQGGGKPIACQAVVSHNGDGGQAAFCRAAGGRVHDMPVGIPVLLEIAFTYPPDVTIA